VIVPIVKDPTGFVLDGNNRLRIALALGVPVPEVVYDCTPDQRDVLRIELNGARRQLKGDQWKPLVDHLRAKGYADRVIARAVGVDRNVVQRYKSPVNVTDSSESVTRAVTGEDGRTQQIGNQNAHDRVLLLIRQSAKGLTASELRSDDVLSVFAESTISHIPGRLRDDGLVRASGKRRGETVWKAVDPPQPPKPKPAARRKAERLLEDLKDTDVHEEVRALIDEGQARRQQQADLKAAEKELNAALAAEEKREVEAQKERLRLAELARDQATKSVKYWEDLRGWVEACSDVLGIYWRDFDDLPPVSMAQVRLLDRALDDLRGQLHRFDVKLHPHGHNRMSQHGEGVIDV
jgi:hypothetical protein